MQVIVQCQYEENMTVPVARATRTWQDGYFRHLTSVDLNYTSKVFWHSRKKGTHPITSLNSAIRTVKMCTEQSTRRKKTRQLLDGFFSTANNKPDDNLLSHWLQHYHRRKVVSR
ncbi:hypothetical protein O3297_28730, partial [Janthinobacterium sp. SUN128]|uniref:hypothetical protein n=1 Tax=Janthinobacterium sp. SUN128 TaxID=3014790 RepID=UPI0027123133